MALCKCGCGRTVPTSRGYKPTVWYSDACRMRVNRAKPQPTANSRDRVSVDALHIVEGDSSLVDRVRALVASQLDTTDEVAQSQGALAVRLAELASEGAVAACRELRLLLLEARVASDPTWEPPPSQATALAILIESVRSVSGEGTLDRPTPPGWQSTAESGEILEWIGHEWFRLRAEDDVDGLHDLERWLGAHSAEIASLRVSGRWAVWPDNRDSL